MSDDLFDKKINDEILKNSVETEVIIGDEILHEGEIHPSTEQALNFIKSIPEKKLQEYYEIIEVNAEENNRTAEVAKYVFDKILKKETIRDIHILGLAWVFIGIMNEQNLGKNK